MTTRRIRRDDYSLKPMPDRRVSVVRDRLFQPEELDVIARGLEPASMEGKWIIFFEAPWLYCYRSWTKVFVYRGRFVKEGDAQRLVEVEIGPCQYVPTIDDPERGGAFFEWLIDALLLGREVPRV